MGALANPAVRASIHSAWMLLNGVLVATLGYAFPDVPNDLWLGWMVVLGALGSVVMAFAAAQTTEPKATP
jgi:hypothetical protein